MQHRLADELFQTMPWDRVDNVVFDVGNVLLRFDPRQILHEFVPDESCHERMLINVFASPYWTAMDHGTMTARQATDAFVRILPDLEDDIRRMMSGWVAMKQTVPEGVAALRKSKAMGKRVFILSNYESDAFRVVEEKYDFLQMCDARIVSSRVGVIKPDERIYRILMERCDCSPAKTLFVDDNPANVEEALTLGWLGLWASSPDRIAKFFEVEG